MLFPRDAAAVARLHEHRGPDLRRAQRGLVRRGAAALAAEVGLQPLHRVDRLLRERRLPPRHARPERRLDAGRARAPALRRPPRRERSDAGLDERRGAHLLHVRVEAGALLRGEVARGEFLLLERGGLPAALDEALQEVDLLELLSDLDHGCMVAPPAGREVIGGG